MSTTYTPRTLSFLFAALGLMLAVTLLSGCASSYKPIVPNTLNYDVREEDGVGFGYRYEVLNYRGNRKYAKRESKKMVRLVAVKIQNNTNTILKLGENCQLYSGNNPVFPMEISNVHKSLKQGVAIYLLYSPIMLTQTECDTGGCESRILFPIGAAIALGNMLGAGGANQNFRRELEQYKLTDKEIRPGDTVYALVGLSASELHPLKLVLR